MHLVMMKIRLTEEHLVKVRLLLITFKIIARKRYNFKLINHVTLAVYNCIL